MSLSVRDRNKNIEKMGREIFDVVLIGGGISGAGVARDAASRGMKVALIEAQDFASGTSSRSSKLIHGGIRYLENLEFGLVFEALSERRNLFEMAPHLVHPLRFVLPMYKGARVGMFKMGLGMWLYDALSLFEAPELHARLSRSETERHVPMLNSRDLVGSYIYSDAYMDDDRLVLETLRSAAHNGVCAANYVRAVGAEMKNGKMTALLARDAETGKELKISARHFVSTVGPWTDLVASELLGKWKKIMRPSKGVHLTFSRERLPLKDAVVMVSDDQSRIVFAIPRHEMVIVGTTDTHYSGDPGDVCTKKEDVEYLLRIAGEYFPGAALKESDILASYSGVRPLVHDGSDTESKTSREHLIFSDSRNITFVTGGKYTTYRKIAEDALKVILENFPLEDRLKWGRGHTQEPLNSRATVEKLTHAREKVQTWAKKFNLNVDAVHFLVERYAAEAEEMLAKWAQRQDRNPALGVWQIEAQQALQETMCLHLRDFYLRRVPLFLAQADHGFNLLEPLADFFQKELGWSKDERKFNVDATRQHLEQEMGWRQKT